MGVSPLLLRGAQDQRSVEGADAPSEQEKRNSRIKSAKRFSCVIAIFSLTNLCKEALHYFEDAFKHKGYYDIIRIIKKKVDDFCGGGGVY